MFPTGISKVNIALKKDDKNGKIKKKNVIQFYSVYVFIHFCRCLFK